MPISNSQRRLLVRRPDNFHFARFVRSDAERGGRTLTIAKSRTNDELSKGSKCLRYPSWSNPRRFRSMNRIKLNSLRPFSARPFGLTQPRTMANDRALDGATQVPSIDENYGVRRVAR